MENKIIAHCIHHTHWDPFWYFTAQDAMVVFAYNIKEMLRAFEQDKIKDFFLDGQTAAIDEYLEVHPEDQARIKRLVQEEKLIIGPFVSQLDPFICSGESVINNLRLGMKHADQLGKASRIAYLADPFGQSIDFPKIFNQFGIHDFVFTRGAGDEYDLGNEFYFESNDGSRVLCHTLLAGYGYGTYAFMDKTLFSDKAQDYNRINVDVLIKRLLERSTLPDEFVFPLGFDQNPIMLHIPELIAYYNHVHPEMEFRYTSWKRYFARVREQGRNIKTFRSELTSPQYHRLHLSGMNSARADIKTILDRAERSLTYETQPLMAMLDSLGIPYDQGIIDTAWYTLVNCQTHASATHPDETNRWVKENGLAALNYSQAAGIYLMRLVASSMSIDSPGRMPVVVFNTMPWERDQVIRMTIVTRKPNFQLLEHDTPVEYTLLNQQKMYGGVQRKDQSLLNEEEWFYQSQIVADVGSFGGISYKTLHIQEIDEQELMLYGVNKDCRIISTDHFIVESTSDGIHITDKKLGKTFRNVLFIQDGGDEGDSYDYSYPDEDQEWIITDDLKDVAVVCVQTPDFAVMTIKGEMAIPASLKARAEQEADAVLRYEINIELNAASPVIRIHGFLHNRSTEHRTRLGIRTGIQNTVSYAGTQFGYVERACDPVEQKDWKEKGIFEEPCSTHPLLNHVSAVGNEYTLTVFTRSLKEYEFTDDGFENIQLTLFRSIGYVGLPDLNRRPGRPSGLANKIIASPAHQMLGENTFDIGIAFYTGYDGNQVMRDYAEFAVNALYYQNQSIDKTIYPISYFPINRWDEELPQQYNFLSLPDFKGSYGTVKKSEKGNGYILQVFNSNQGDTTAGEMKCDPQCISIESVNLLEEHLAWEGQTIIKMKRGELKNLRFFITKKEE